MSQLFPGRAPLIPRAPTSPQCAISKVRRATRIDDPDATNFPPQSVLDRYSVPGTQPRFVGANCWDPWRRCWRSEEHTSELQSQSNIACRLLLETNKPT